MKIDIDPQIGALQNVAVADLPSTAIDVTVLLVGRTFAVITIVTAPVIPGGIAEKITGRLTEMTVMIGAEMTEIVIGTATAEAERTGTGTGTEMVEVGMDRLRAATAEIRMETVP